MANMRLSQSALTFTSLLSLATAHFVMHYPSSRNGDVDDGEAKSPCAGFPVSSNRTTVSLPSFPIALEMGHDETVIQILLSLATDPTEDDFNITLERTFSQTGLGEFCLPMVTVPDTVKAGDKGTVQVVTDGEGGGGLYVCADVTFANDQQPLPSSCKNNTGVTATPLPADDTINANQSDATGAAQSGDASSSASASGSEASSTSSAGEAVQTAMLAGWGLIGAGVVGAVALL